MKFGTKNAATVQQKQEQALFSQEASKPAFFLLEKTTHLKCLFLYFPYN